jgi:tetraacyldisaccharide 4'-kinase
MGVMTIQEVWYGSSSAAKTIRVLLLPLSWLYALGWQIYLWGYKVGIKKPYKPSCEVICVGNFSAGGTGKTPTVIFIANCLRDLEVPFVIGCSGYGSPRSVGATVAPAGSLDAGDWGDEPAELRECLPDVPLIVGRARVTASKLCESEFPGSVLLMDDGFQHMPLAKDVSIVLDPETSNSFTFPAGPYREPRSSGIKRANLVIPSADFTHHFSALSYFATGGVQVPAPSKAWVLTAIGRPDKFVSALKDSGVNISGTVILPDHDKLELDFDAFAKDLPVVVTRKDWVKLRQSSRNTSVDFIIAERSATIEPVSEFKKWLKMKLG